MAKKFFVRSKVVKGVRWHIDYTVYNLENGSETRHRRDFSLNTIFDLKVRSEVARILCLHLEEFLLDSPAKRIAKTQHSETVLHAVEVALAQKLKLPRENSHRTYKSVTKAFKLWLEKEGLSKLPIKSFTRKYALAYWDLLTDGKKYAGTTLQNIKIHLAALWSEMINRELAEANPWSGIKPPPANEKMRRPFTQEERKAVAIEAEKTDYWLFRAILLQFYCYIRPVEITRLRFRDFDLEKGTVVVQAGNAKKWQKRTATIPEAVLHYFKDGRFDQYPGNYLVLSKFDRGKNNFMVAPGMVPIDHDRMYRRHRKLLLRLVKKGKLKDITGLTWYSWKDTGISLHTRKTSPVATKDQAGHKDLSITSLYYHPEEINPEYRKLPNDLF